MIETLVEIEHKEDFGEQGFYSKTYIGFDKRLARDVAVKDIITKNVSTKEDFEEYFQEAQKLSIAAHPRILPVFFVGINHEDGEDDDSIGTPRIVTKYLKNGSLNSYLNQVFANGTTLDLDECIRFSHQIIQGMIHLHSLDILHLDLKASNVFIGDDNKLVLADFGQSKFMKEEIITKVNDLYPVINPPENLKKRGMDKTADIYQFGILLYSIFNYDKYRDLLDNKYNLNTTILNQLFKNGQKLPEEQINEFKENMKELSRDIRSASFPNREDYHFFVPKKIKEIINKCIAVNVADRYNNFYDIQRDFNEFIFPKGVSSVNLIMQENKVCFKKDDKNCCILVTLNGDRHDLMPAKGTQRKPGKYRERVTKTKLPAELFKIMDEL